MALAASAISSMNAQKAPVRSHKYTSHHTPNKNLFHLPDGDGRVATRHQKESSKKEPQVSVRTARKASGSLSICLFGPLVWGTVERHMRHSSSSSSSSSSSLCLDSRACPVPRHPHLTWRPCVCVCPYYTCFSHVRQTNIVAQLFTSTQELDLDPSATSSYTYTSRASHQNPKSFQHSPSY